MFVVPEELASGKITMFGVQTAHQRDVLWPKYAHKLMIVDSTACVTRYKHVVHGMVTVDEHNKGLSLGWLFVESESKKNILPLLKVMRERTGPTKPKVFASDDAPALFNSWYYSLFVQEEHTIFRTGAYGWDPLIRRVVVDVRLSITRTT